MKLLSETKLLDDRSVSLDILLSEVSKKLLSVTNHLRETSLRVEILGISLHMLGKSIDSAGKECNLHLRRTSIVLALCMSSNDLLLEFLFHLYHLSGLASYLLCEYLRGWWVKHAIGAMSTDRGTAAY